jgi:hypothetical protein
MVSAQAPIRPKRTNPAAIKAFSFCMRTSIPPNTLGQEGSSHKNRVSFKMSKAEISWQTGVAAMVHFTPSPPRRNQDRQLNQFYPLNQPIALNAMG